MSARMEGLDAYYGKAVSEHADRHLDLVGLGQVMALTPQHDFNELSCLRYRAEFGSQHCYFISTNPAKNNGEVISRIKSNARIHTLFGNKITYAKIASLLGQDAKIRQTKLTENFGFGAYQAQYGRRSILLFAITGRRTLRFFVEGQTLNPEPGWTLVALVQEHDATPTETNPEHG
jgi:CPA1 family monovalent cation:H+ antiporter